MLFRITVVKCTDLPPMDSNGFSDPFVELWVVNSKTNKYLEPPKLPQEIKKTQTVMKNLNPHFNETFEFDFSEKLRRIGQQVVVADSSSASPSTTGDGSDEVIDEDFNCDDPMDHMLMIRIVDWDKFTKNDVIGFVLLQVFGLNLKPNEKQRRIFPIVGPENGTIELLIESVYDPKSMQSSSYYGNLPPRASLSYDDGAETPSNVIMTVGPILGTVTSNSARILVECSKDLLNNNDTDLILPVECYPIGERSHLEKREDYLEKRMTHIHMHDTHGSYHETILKRSLLTQSMKKKMLAGDDSGVIRKKIRIPKANIPHTFTIDGLLPDFVYRIEFPNVVNSKTRVGIIKTMISDKLGDELSTKSHHLSLACVSCNLIERRIPDKDVWERMLEKVDEIDVLLHCGDQIYSDCGHNAFDESIRIADGRTKLSKDEENEIKELFRKYYRLNWNHPPTRRIMSQVSNFMILDDHEIRDDWGSDPCDKNKTSVEYYIGRLARDVYWEYQRSLREDVLSYNYEETFKKHEGYYHVIGDYGILFLDLRAARSFNSEYAGDKPFLTQPQWDDLERWLFEDENALASEKVKALVCVCSVPLVFLNKKMTDSLPKITSKLSDMRDHWNYGTQFNEQLGILNAVNRWKNEHSNREALFVAGDVHIGGVTDISYNDEMVLKQLTSSSVSNNEFSWCLGLSMRCMLHKSSNLKQGWRFKHQKWTRKRNYGIVHIATDGEKVKPVMNPYLNTYIKSYRN